MRLRTISRDVPGLRSLQVTVSPLPIAAAATPAPAATGPMRLTQKFAVFMFRNQRYLIGPYGERYLEGQQFEGFKISRIGVDQVLFERDGREFQFYVAAL